MATELSPTALHFVASLLSPRLVYSLKWTPLTYVTENFIDTDDGVELPLEYLHSDGIKIASSWLSVESAVDMVFSPGDKPLMLFDQCIRNRTHRLVKALVKRFETVAREPHHFRPVEAYYFSVGWTFCPLLEDVFETLFPCWRCDGSFEMVNRRDDETFKSRCFVVRYHLSQVGGRRLTAEICLFPPYGPYFKAELRMRIFEHDDCICPAKATISIDRKRNQSLLHNVVRLEAFTFLSRFELDKCQVVCTERFVERHVAVLPLYRVRLSAIGILCNSLNVSIVNESIASFRAPVHQFTLPEDAANDSAVIRRRLRKAFLKQFRLIPYGRQVWQWALRALRDIRGVVVGGFFASGDSRTMFDWVTLQHCLDVVSTKGLRHVQLRVDNVVFNALNDHAGILRQERIRKLESIFIDVTFNVYRARGTYETSMDASWLPDIFHLPACRQLEFAFDAENFDANLDSSAVENFAAALADMCMQADSLDGLVRYFAVDYDVGLGIAFVPPQANVAWEGVLELRLANLPNSHSFTVACYYVENAKSKETVTFVVGEFKFRRAFRLYKGRIEFSKLPTYDNLAERL